MDINLEYYKIFYHVAKNQSITSAAETLSISQPAVSQAIKHLEQDLGCTLFVRMSKGVRLTKEGELLFSYVERGYETILFGEHKLAEMLNLDAGEIRIGASDMTLQFYLLDYLEQFHERYPGIKVVVTNAPTPETLRHLKDGKIDFGIVSTPIPENGKLKTTSVREIRDIFVAGNNFEMLKGRVLSYQELEKFPVMYLEGTTSTRKYVEQFLLDQGVVLNPEFELATSEMLVQFAVRNLGIASVVEDFARKKIEQGELFELTFEQEIPTRQFCIVTNERLPVSPAAEKLLRFLLSET